MKVFIPKQIIFEKGTDNYPITKQIKTFFQDNPNVLMTEAAPNKVKSLITLDTIPETYQNGKKTLVVSKKKSSAFQTCKPSADYMLPLVSGCMGQCEYCYLHTQLGDKPYMRVHVNIDDIFEKAVNYMNEKPDKITVFEGSATSDPLCVEPYTNSLKETILFFANEPHGSFRFVTKFNDVDTLLGLEHHNKTEIRFSLNTDYVISNFEHGTASRDARIHAASKVMEAEYPVGFLIAPVFLYETWKQDYKDLLVQLKNMLPQHPSHPITFEVITHRFTPRAKNIIQDIFPDTKLPMEEELRQYKHGQFGYCKYVYKKEDMQAVKAFFQTELNNHFPNGIIKYII